MSRMFHFQSSLARAKDDSAPMTRKPAVVKTALTKLAVLVIASVTASAVLAAPSAAPTKSTAPASVVLKAQQADPLAGDTWHALNGTWPGTIVFDHAKKTVTLAPVGATPMQATYTYTVKPSTNENIVEGTLRMTNSANQVSDSTFRIEGKALTLAFASGQRPEQYVRMSPKEEAAEKARLQKMISEGRIRPLKQ